jgi:F-type H+-transporting ATPase subunit b
LAQQNRVPRLPSGSAEWYKFPFTLLPNLSIIWVIIAVLALTAILDRLLLRPILDVIRRREHAIDSARDLARQSAAQAQQAAAEFDQRTTAARADLYRQMDEMRRAALGRRAEIVEQTRTEAEAQVAAAARRLDEEAAEAKRRLAAESETLGAAIAERILGRRAS